MNVKEKIKKAKLLQLGYKKGKVWNLRIWQLIHLKFLMPRHPSESLQRASWHP